MQTVDRTARPTANRRYTRVKANKLNGRIRIRRAVFVRRRLRHRAGDRRQDRLGQAAGRCAHPRPPVEAVLECRHRVVHAEPRRQRRAGAPPGRDLGRDAPARPCRKSTANVQTMTGDITIGSAQVTNLKSVGAFQGRLR
jgi:hypothetical protein